MNNTTCNKRTSIILFLSLSLNVFALGYMFGNDGMHGFGRHMPFGGFSRQLDKLAEPAKSQVKTVMDQYKPKLKAEMQQIRNVHEQIDTAIKNPNYSRKQVEVLMAKLHTESDKAQALAQAMMLDIADKLSPEDRAKFFDHSRFGRSGPPVGDAKPSP